MNGLQLVEFQPAVDVESVIENYRRNGAVEYAEPDYEVHVSAAPNDPQYLSGALWALNNTGQSGGVNDADIDALEGWSVRTQAADIIVAVIDTGVRYTHEDLAANMWTNPGEIAGNGIDDDFNGFVDDVRGVNAIANSGNPDDDHGHGTHVAGTIGGVGNNGVGVVGVAWNVKLMACKFLDSFGSGYTSDAIECINYARIHGASVMNNSWGGGGNSQGLQDAINAARSAGIIFVAAAGNSSSDSDAYPFYPAGSGPDNIVSVAATTRQDGLAYFSNFGQGSVDIGAPGLDIYSTWNTSDSVYKSLSGTSMAAPVVSGVIALMKAQFPDENHYQLLNRIYGSVDPLIVLSNKCRTGGRINLANALNSVSSRPGNDDFGNSMVLTRSSFSIKGINADATKETGEPNHAGNAGGKSIWWSWRPQESGVATLTTTGSTFNTLLAVYTGTTLSDLTLVDGNDDSPAGGTASRVVFNVEKGTNYFIAVDGFGGESGSSILKCSLLARPVNDNFADRIPITGSIATVTGSNSVATLQAGEPDHGGPGGHSVWWSWTASVSGPATFSTTGSDFNTLLAIYTGASVSNLTFVASNDNDPTGGTSSRVTFNAIAGTTYEIAVDGFGAATGRITLNTPPLNDHFANRIVLSGASPSAIGFNILATKEALELNHAGDSGGKSLWWSWTAPSSGKVTINTLGSTFDTTLAVYTGSTPGNLSLITSNDNSPYDLGSLLSLNTIAGTTYQIAVDGANGAFGKVLLAIGNSGYTITDMGGLPGYPSSGAYSVNNSGVMAGQFMTGAPGYTNHACIWTSVGGIQPLLTGDTTSQANDINDFNQVVGALQRPGYGSIPFLWQNGVMIELGGLTSHPFGEAYAIDNEGRVVGWSASPNNSIHAFLWHNGVMKDLGAIGSNRTRAYGLNGPDLIVGGWGTFNAGPGLAMMWKNFVITDVTTPLPALDSVCLDVNSLSQIVGIFRTDNYRRGFLWENGTVRDLGAGPTGGWTRAVSINNLGQIVGDENDRTALLWQDGEWTALSSLLPAASGWTKLFFTYEINDHGQIAGAGTLNGNTRGFLLTPLSPVTPRPLIVSPTNQQHFLATMDIPIVVNLVPNEENVEKVEYFQGAVLIGTVTNPPFNFVWHDVPAGQHVLSARTTDTSGEMANSQEINLVVVPPPSVNLVLTAEKPMLSWPTSSFGSFAMEMATNLDAPISWMPLTNPVVVSNGMNRTIITITNDSRFFRLRSVP